MALAPNASAEPAGEGVHAPDLQLFVFALFFIFGGITSLNDVIIPKLKELFTLNNFEASLVQVWFFIAYAVVGIPGAKLVKRIGYMRGAAAGLVTMIAGCLLFIPASQTATFSVFLFAYFVLASGVVLVQVVSNPLISLLGPPRTAPSRLTFAQAFNSLGTTIFPYFGAILILGSLAQVSAAQLSGAKLDAYRTAETQAIVTGYLGIAAALAAVALAVWLFRDRVQGERHEDTSLSEGLALLKRPRFGFGALCIFLYVGAEVAVGSFLVGNLTLPESLGASPQDAGKLIPIYWGLAMLGRFAGSAVLRVVSPAAVLAFNAIGAAVLITVSMATTGTVSGYALLGVGLMNSIMFPVIFTLASEGLGSRAADGSGIINVAIVGGAVVPALYGLLADQSGLRAALILPIACYAVIAAFGIYARRPVAG
ncbi:MAG: sugar MFS transporter [Sphingomonas sp.]|uniref:sugar MFS transporter n=1 Tax=Sphingomonas sp. TaxID=28214 RepID=UPI000DB3D9D4|nr:sugar MFS transporter [Sphingomonas sp.]PZP19011.1 MAG: glucose/galactose MFS transporter [Sphingomonas hengshuiensis]